MSIKIEITGGDATEIAQSLVSLAFMVAPNLRDSVARMPTPEPAEAETVEPPKKPRGRPKKKSETIEHEAKPEAEAEPEPDTKADGADEKAEENVDPESDVEPAEDEPDMTIDDLRKYMLSNYLLKHFSDLDAQKKEFQDLLGKFDIKAIADLPEDKIGEFKAMVDARAAEKAK